MPPLRQSNDAMTRLARRRPVVAAAVPAAPMLLLALIALPFSQTGAFIFASAATIHVAAVMITFFANQ